MYSKDDGRESLDAILAEERVSKTTKIVVSGVVTIGLMIALAIYGAPGMLISVVGIVAYPFLYYALCPLFVIFRDGEEDHGSTERPKKTWRKSHGKWIKVNIYGPCGEYIPNEEDRDWNREAGKKSTGSNRGCYYTVGILAVCFFVLLLGAAAAAYVQCGGGRCQ